MFRSSERNRSEAHGREVDAESNASEDTYDTSSLGEGRASVDGITCDEEDAEMLAQMNKMKQDAYRACLAEVELHLGAFLKRRPSGTYEQWIGDFHPENLRTNVLAGMTIDYRFYISGSDHLRLWNERAADGRRVAARDPPDATPKCCTPRLENSTSGLPLQSMAPPQALPPNPGQSHATQTPTLKSPMLSAVLPMQVPTMSSVRSVVVPSPASGSRVLLLGLPPCLGQGTRGSLPCRSSKGVFATAPILSPPMQGFSTTPPAPAPPRWLLRREVRSALGSHVYAPPSGAQQSFAVTPPPPAPPRWLPCREASKQEPRVAWPQVRQASAAEGVPRLPTPVKTRPCVAPTAYHVSYPVLLPTRRPQHMACTMEQAVHCHLVRAPQCALLGSRANMAFAAAPKVVWIAPPQYVVQHCGHIHY